ncbi:MAG: glycosyltransferase family 2 protein [Burkholderiales bacterium]
MSGELIASVQHVAHSATPREHVAILLGTRNGAGFLGPQLDSIGAQTHGEWSVWASDDGSTDATTVVLAEYRRRWGAERLFLKRGPVRGFCANFLSLVCAPQIHADYFAYCDQDDLWDHDKLERALKWLRKQAPGQPALYCGRTRLIDANGRALGNSPLFARPVGFANAIVQSVAGGNTMVFNAAARALLVEAGGEVDVQTHDWWTYIVVAACGGVVHYDARPAVGYRQHPDNLVGSNHGARSKVARARRLLAGEFREMNHRNLAALGRLSRRLTPESRNILEMFCRARSASLPARTIAAWKSGIYCHTLLGNSGLALAAVLKKL